MLYKGLSGRKLDVNKGLNECWNELEHIQLNVIILSRSFTTHNRIATEVQYTPNMSNIEQYKMLFTNDILYKIGTCIGKDDRYILCNIEEDSNEHICFESVTMP